MERALAPVRVQKQGGVVVSRKKGQTRIEYRKRERKTTRVKAALKVIV